MDQVEIRRRRVQAMMEEDKDDSDSLSTPSFKEESDDDYSPKSAPTHATKLPRPNKRKPISSPATPPRASTSTLSFRPSNQSPTPKLAVKFAGKVFRTLDKPGMYSPLADFLGEPEEEVGEANRERGEKRRLEIQREMSKVKRPRFHYQEGSGSTTKPVASRSSSSIKHLFQHAAPLSHPPSPDRHYTPPSSPSLGLPFSAFAPGAKMTATSSNPTTIPSPHQLPPSLSNLLKLHIILEGALLIHLANEGSAVASSTSKLNSAGQAVLRIPNLINLPDLRKKIESGGRSFGEKELAKLVWVWEGCGQKEGTDEDTIESEDELRLDTGESGGMGFIVTRTRASTATGIVSTFGIGISVAIKQNPQLPQFEIIAPPSSPSRSPKSPCQRSTPASPVSIGRGREGMSVVALWSQGQEARRGEFAARLREWANRCAEDEAANVDPNLMSPRRLPDIPHAHLPSLMASTPCVAGTTAPSPQKPRSDVFTAVSSPTSDSNAFSALLAGKSANKAGGTPRQRLTGLAARIQAKADSRRTAYQESLSALEDGVSPTQKSLKKDKEIGTAWRAEQAERYKRNSMLSRLGNVADGVWMLFDVGRKRSMSLADVSTSISKSSKVNISLDEAQESLVLLCEICPDFVYTKMVDRQEWFCVKGLIGLKETKEQIRAELSRSSPLSAAL